MTVGSPWSGGSGYGLTSAPPFSYDSMTAKVYSSAAKASRPEARIDGIAQSWAVLSEVADPRRAAQAMEQADELLGMPQEGLVRLFTPPFDTSEPDPGYVRAYPPGWLWENLYNAVVGIIAGALVLGVVAGIARLRGKPANPAH